MIPKKGAPALPHKHRLLQRPAPLPTSSFRLASTPSFRPVSASLSTPIGTTSATASTPVSQPLSSESAQSASLPASSFRPSSAPSIRHASALLSTPFGTTSASATIPVSQSFTTESTQSDPSTSSTHIAIESTQSDESVEQHGYLLGSTRPDRRLCIGIRAKTLDPHGYKWANLSTATIQFYWDEFQVAWENKAKERCRQYIYNMSSITRNPTRKKPTHVFSKVWTAWNTMWNTEEFKKRSEQSKKNRRKCVVDGRALPTHNGGSTCYLQIANNMEKSLGCPPSTFDVFVYTHMKDHVGKTFIVDNAKQVHVILSFFILI